MPRDVSLSDSKCWNGGQKWVESKAIIPALTSLLVRIVPGTAVAHAVAAQRPGDAELGDVALELLAEPV